MKTVIADQKRRIVLPNAKPGEVYAVREVETGHLELSLMVPAPQKRKRRAEVDKLLATAALTPEMSWETLRQLTRES